MLRKPYNHIIYWKAMNLFFYYGILYVPYPSAKPHINFYNVLFSNYKEIVVGCEGFEPSTLSPHGGALPVKLISHCDLYGNRTHNSKSSSAVELTTHVININNDEGIEPTRAAYGNRISPALPSLEELIIIYIMYLLYNKY